MTEAQTELLPPEPKKGKLAKREQSQLVAATPMELLSIAVSQGADIDKLSKLMDLQERWEKNEARKAFVEAMNAFKADAPAITKNRHVEYQTSKGVTSYDHATIDQVCGALIPALSKYGLHHRWKVAQENGRIRVTCVITHAMGHSEETTMESGPDDSGGKNAIQAISSATSYLERYTFLAATGTAAKNTDTDGVVSEQLPGLDEMLRKINEAPDVSAAKKEFGEAYRKAKLAKNANAELQIIAAYDKRKAELTATEAA